MIKISFYIVQGQAMRNMQRYAFEKELNLHRKR